MDSLEGMLSEPLNNSEERLIAYRKCVEDTLAEYRNAFTQQGHYKSYGLERSLCTNETNEDLGINHLRRVKEMVVESYRGGKKAIGRFIRKSFTKGKCRKKKEVAEDESESGADLILRSPPPGVWPYEYKEERDDPEENQTD